MNFRLMSELKRPLERYLEFAHDYVIQNKFIILKLRVPYIVYSRVLLLSKHFMATSSSIPVFPNLYSDGHKSGSRVDEKSQCHESHYISN